MIKKLQNHKLEISKQMHSLFQLSYAVEAKLLDAVDFPPLKRPIESYQESKTTFYGYLEHGVLAGIIEISHSQNHTRINSLVVSPMYFRRGIGGTLLEFVFDAFDSAVFVVETGANNKPATQLYKSLGFKEIEQWETDFGIRKVRFEKRVD
ncbi:GNAT family N-acetyltransferase [Subsaximicrobium wynnwilliamsii]|uniref:GNAT family N-acetyltransferase n=1 Tax=Subsaximicrobium wynnwilliamsii TaxID=291179 RepID=A0A5C6ZI48_9FLAO|nr:GNAT family N-acetyltransferase [Subsaximicrobium wynnwilliamsii]TXD82899.1 GNAT family N-acetyltransferase [Subsaximicrobium wynnwilliamsii]TXD88621.1 GNAT family N-acetyltransferase [Subsaximicrobium wynnwilliamsii]TXE02713.1 GNAT family N-acetyltransferase [Subsaximicrobium wynnwilliamsii]